MFKTINNLYQIRRKHNFILTKCLDEARDCSTDASLWDHMHGTERMELQVLHNYSPQIRKNLLIAR
jgi:hypothetical protein